MGTRACKEAVECLVISNLFKLRALYFETDDPSHKAAFRAEMIDLITTIPGAASRLEELVPAELVLPASYVCHDPLELTIADAHPRESEEIKKFLGTQSYFL